MSSNTNSVKEISYNDLKNIQNNDLPFLLFFKGEANNSRSIGGMWCCNYYCSIYPLVQCYAIRWNEYKLKNSETRSIRLFNVVKFKGHQEISFNVGSVNYGDLEKLFSTTHKECEIMKRSLQQPKQNSQSNQPYTSNKNETTKIESQGELLKDENYVPKSSRSPKPLTSMHIPELSLSHSIKQTPIPNISESVKLREHELTYKHKLQKATSDIRPSMSDQYSLKCPSSPRQKSNPHSAIIISHSCERSTSIIQKFLIHQSQPQSPKVKSNLQTSPTSSLKSLLSITEQKSTSHTPNFPSTENKYLLKLSPANSVDLTDSAKKHLRPPISPTRFVMQTQYSKIKQPSSSSHNKEMRCIFIPQLVDHNYVRFCQSPKGVIPKRSITQQRQIQPHDPLSGQNYPRRTRSHCRQRRTTSSRSSLSHKRLLTSNSNPNPKK